jgi:ParB-like nuclease domain
MKPIAWANLGVKNVQLTDLVLRRDIQPRGAPGRGEMRRSGGPQKGKNVPSAVNRYANRMRVGDLPPPIHVCRYRGRLLLVDGFQRVAAAEIVGRTELPAKIAPADDMNAVRAEAVRANLDHGVPLGSNTKK